MSAQPDDRSETAGPLRARDIMTKQIISIGPNETIPAIARLLLDHRISAVPVVDDDGVPVGMVSEGDLVGREQADRVGRVDWWLALATGQQKLDEAFQARLQAESRTARDVMTAPLVTVNEDADIGQIARLLARHRIKRVPVLRDGRITGIVSRADLVGVMATVQPHLTEAARTKHVGLLQSLLTDFFRPSHVAAPETGTGRFGRDHAAAPASKEAIAANDFRRLVEDFHSGEVQHRDAARRQAAEQRCQRAKALIDQHVSDDSWRDMLHHARDAAEKGLPEYLMLRFPSELCTDGGRAINNVEEAWPSTLRGEPAEMYLRWEHELKPQGFLLSARILDFPEGKPGDVGLFLAWGE